MLSGICVAIFFRVFVRQTTGATPVVTTTFYDLQGNQISSQQKQPSSFDLAKSDWHWLQWNQTSISSAYKLRITLGSKSSLAGSQEIHYDKVCASIASAPTGKILASPIHRIYWISHTIIKFSVTSIHYYKTMQMRRKHVTSFMVF